MYDQQSKQLSTFKALNSAGVVNGQLTIQKMGGVVNNQRLKLAQSMVRGGWKASRALYCQMM